METNRFELVAFDHLENQTFTADSDQDLQALLRRNFEKVMTGLYQVDYWEGSEKVETVDLKYMLLDFFLMECGLYSNDQRDQILSGYKDLGEE